LKIRHKITIWITLTAVAAALGFAVFVFVEFLEEPIKLIDAELGHMAEAMVSRNLAVEETVGRVDRARLPYPPDLYWIRVRGPSGRVIYRSRLAREIKLPERGGDAWFFETTVSRQRFQIGQDADDGVTFRVNKREVAVDGRNYQMMIAKPVEDLEEELIDLAREAAAGLVSFTLVLILVSYFIAGRILAPVEAINRLAREITGRTLDQRIPVGDNRDELSELSRTLNLMFDRLQHSFRRQKEFIAAAAHELKSPLALMMLSQEELLRRPDNGADLSEGLERQFTAMRRLKLLLTKLLDLSNLEVGGWLEISEICPAGIISEVLEDFSELIRSKGLGLVKSLDPDLRLAGDQGKIRRLFINLLDNAIRYNCPGGEIRVAVAAEDGEIVIRVGNSGQGIPQGELERVFDQFYRLEGSRSEDTGGSGLGLTIARRIVELHRGRIAIASRPGAMTEVTVRLPGRA